METKIKYAYQNLNIFHEVHRRMLLLISSFGWMLHIFACKMRFQYCFSLSSSFLSFICFIFMLFFRSKRIEAASISSSSDYLPLNCTHESYLSRKCSIFSSSIFVTSFSGSNIAYYPSYE
jgi:hypothetical protein